MTAPSSEQATSEKHLWQWCFLMHGEIVEIRHLSRIFSAEARWTACTKAWTRSFVTCCDFSFDWAFKHRKTDKQCHCFPANVMKYKHINLCSAACFEPVFDSLVLLISPVPNVSLKTVSLQSSRSLSFMSFACLLIWSSCLALWKLVLLKRKLLNTPTHLRHLLYSLRLLRMKFCCGCTWGWNVMKGGRGFSCVHFL